jgi:hypothetical protein
MATSEQIPLSATDSRPRSGILILPVVHWRRPPYSHVQFSMKTHTAVLQLGRIRQQQVHSIKTFGAGFGARRYTPTMDRRAKLEPAKRVAGRKQDVWYVCVFCTFVSRRYAPFPPKSRTTR